MPNQSNEQFDEIDLTEYIKVIIKSWRLIANIIALTLIVAVLAHFFLLSSQTYEASSLIKIGTINNKTIMDSTQTKQLLLTEHNARKILKQLPWQEPIKITKPLINNFLTKIQINPKTKEKEEIPKNFFKIIYQNGSPEITLKTAKLLQEKTLAIHQEEYDKQIKFRDLSLKQKEAELIAAKQELKDKEIAVDKLYNLRYPAAYAEAQGRGLATYLNARDQTRDRVEKLTKEIEAIKLRIQERDKMSQVIDEPQLPQVPIKSQSLIMTLSIALLLGLFISIFGAFGKHWWMENKEELKN